MIIVDGITYNIPFISLDRSADFLDKYAKRTESGDLSRKLIGVFYNYELKLGRTTSVGSAEYDALWDKLTEPVEFHMVTVPGSNGDYTYKAYFSSVKDSLQKQKDADNYWKNLTVSFLAKSPARVPRS